MTANVRPIAHVVYRVRDLQAKVSAPIKINEPLSATFSRMLLTGMADGYTLAVCDICEWLDRTGHRHAARELARAVACEQVGRESSGNP